MPPTHQARSDQWATWLAPSSGATFAVSTTDMASTVMPIPMPMPVLSFTSGEGSSFALSRPVPRLPPAFAARAEPEHAAYVVAEPPPLPELPVAVPEAYEDPPAEPPMAEPAEPVGAQCDLRNRIELIIDSLPHHTLIESIPVAIDPLGDDMFIATVCDVAISATGAGVGEALLVLKEQIEFLYEDLREKPKLDEEQKLLLQVLQTYIGPPPSGPEWL